MSKRGKKYCIAGQDTEDNMAHARCMMDTEDYKHTHTHTVCIILIAFPTSTMVARTRPSVTLHVRCFVL